MRTTALHRFLLTLAVCVPLATGPLAAHEEPSEPVCYQKEVDEEGNPTGPRFCSQDVWFHEGSAKAGNAAAVTGGTYASWDTNKPTRSVTQGAGAGYFGNGVQRQQNGASDPLTGATFEGEFTGNIDNLAVTLYLFAPGRQNETTYYAGVDLVIDDKTILTINQDGFPLTPGGNAVLKTDFTITGIHEAMELHGVDVGEDVKHGIHLFVTPYPLATATSVFVFDTTEVPAGMTFNVPGDVSTRFLLQAG